MARRANDRQRWLNDRKREAERAYSAALASGYEREALIFKHAAEQLIEHENPEFFNAVGHMSRMPVTIDEFMDSGEFLGCDTDEPLMEMWPKLRPVIRSMNPDVFVGEAPMHTILMGGATGWGKTHAALATNLYQVYLLSCFDNPHALFGLNKSTTPIVFMFMTVSGTVTKRVLFQPFRAVWTNMPYAKRWTRWDRRRESELVLDNNVHIVPALASLQSMVGQAICGAITDEISFMSIVEESKQVAGNYGMGGRYDQADIVFSNITRRRARSFTTRGVSIGCVCAPSSTRYKGDYIDQKMAEAEELQTPGVLTQRYKQYDIAPLKDAEDLLGKTFRLLVGTDDYPTRVLHDPNENVPTNALVENVPISYKRYFLSDPEGAARDVLGIASHSITPFFAQRHKVIEAILDGKEAGLRTYVRKSELVLGVDGMPQIDEELLPLDRETPRFVHVDLSSTIDATGISIVKYDGHTPIIDPQQPDRYELMPKFVVEAAISIKPDSLNQIDPAEVRKWVIQLATFHKLNIACVSYDSWQSKESLGLLRAAGIPSQEISVDKTSEPYRTFRSAVYEGRVQLPDLEHLRLEMISLEYIADKDKIDHPPKGKKDCSDAVCGAIYAASRHRLIRMQDVTVNQGGQPQYQNAKNMRRDMVRAPGQRRR
jgi:hypothetical protein